MMGAVAWSALLESLDHGSAVIILHLMNRDDRIVSFARHSSLQIGA